VSEAKKYGGIDNFRMIAALLIVAIHTSPLLSVNSIADFTLTRIVGRVAVPFFFMTSGLFLFSKNGDTKGKILRFLKKTAILYGIAIVLYLPINIYMGYFHKGNLFFNVIKDIVFDGTMYHLWYLPASMIGAVLAAGLIRKLSFRGAFVITMILYLIGLFGDSYYGIGVQSQAVKTAYNWVFIISDYTRNGIFFAPVFFVLGGVFANHEVRINKKYSIIGFWASIILMTTEGLLLHNFNLMRHDSMYLFLIPCMFFLFNMILMWEGKSYTWFRELSMMIYIIHPMMIILIHSIFTRLRIGELMKDNSLSYYILVATISGGTALCITFVIDKFRKDTQSKTNHKKSRSWIEINTENLKHNARTLISLMPQECEMMAVVKANAYGHGAVRVSKVMNEIGVRAFAVATIDEAIELRKNGIRGEILVLGYTDIGRANDLHHYQLIQTVIDYDYAIMLSNCARAIEVHIKIDTGMHRLGINVEEIDHIFEIFHLKGVKVSGIYTHLCVADSLEREAVNYSWNQIECFYYLLRQLKDRNVTLPKIHIQSSYGFLNYNELQCNYARIGIALYGSLSSFGDRTKTSVDLRPVLSLKSRITTIREVLAGESIGYGRDFRVNKDSKIAVIPIGYADGLPRNLTQGLGRALVQGKQVPIIGRICMDQLVIDITDITNINKGDIVTLIGCDGVEEIPAVNVAKSAGSITNELFSRLGGRIERIYL